MRKLLAADRYIVHMSVLPGCSVAILDLQTNTYVGHFPSEEAAYKVRKILIVAEYDHGA